MIKEFVIKEVNKILDEVSRAIQADRSTLFLLDRDAKWLESIVAQGVEEITIKIPVGTGIIGKCVGSSTPIIENDTDNSLFFDHTYDQLLDYRTRTVVCVPVYDDNGKIIGGLQSLNTKKNGFTPKDARQLEHFAKIIAALIKNTTNSFLDKRRKKAYETLLEAFGKITSELDFEHLVPLIMDKAAEITNSERSTLFFLDNGTGHLKSKYAKGLSEEGIEVKKGIAGLTLDTKMSLIVNDPYAHPNFNPSIDKKTGYVTNSILCVPIYKTEGVVIGVIQVINHKGSGYGSQEQEVLEGFAGQIGISLSNSVLFKEINGMKNYLNVLIDNMDNGIVTLDRQGTVQTYNQRFLKLFQLSDRDSFQKGCRIADLDSSIKKVLNLCLTPLDTNKKYLEFDLVYTLGNSRKTVFNLSALPMENGIGELVGVIGIFQDVSKEKRIRSNLSRYIPQHLVNEIVNKDNLSILKSKNRRCTILFCDIRNFTALTETLGANEVVRLLNTYFDVMVEAIHDNHGVLDKFIGDAVMGVFGLPYTNTNDAIHAINCALKMLERLDELNKSGAFEVVLEVGIGISTGNVISGNIGSDKRYEYTVIGAPVNLASRLEGETKRYSERILICNDTYSVVKEHFVCKKLGNVPIKGKKKAQKVYAIRGEKE